MGEGSSKTQLLDGGVWMEGQHSVQDLCDGGGPTQISRHHSVSGSAERS